ncbi:MAG: PocR ligand-binding domain-containing protein [Sporomusaceae bacterium]|nr:PocR ligand-binding domain-containing protein [Sporomusaceae bacterium]
MNRTNQLTLGETVNVQILQEIQDKFSDATGLAAVIVDAEGNPITRPSNFTRFCKIVRSTAKGLERCINCDDQGGRRHQKPSVYRCHAGLTDLAAPIIVQDQYIGAFLGGQVLVAPKESKAKDEMFDFTADLAIDNDQLGEAFNEVKVIAKKRIQAAADLMYIMANYIVEIGAANISGNLLMEEMKAKADLEAMLRATELKALQSQVNPHFLFNTLNTIARLALLEGATQTQEVVYALADLLRNNLRDMDDLRTLEQEIKSITDYLTIQKVRFGERIRAVIDVDPQIADIKVPALTLQPLIENAIIHGLERKVEGGKVKISAKRYGDHVMISVVDTGVGLPQEKINTIFQAEKRKETHGQTTGLGILNVHKRIQHYFGSEYGVKIDSVLGEGTTVEIHLPYHCA